MTKTDDIKAMARAEARTLRKSMPQEAEAIALAGLSFVRRLDVKGVIAGYVSQGSEADTRLLLTDLDRAGFELALPVVTSRDAPLTFRRWAPGDTLEPDLMGIPAPAADAPEIVPTLVFVPLLAFDVAGYRLGQGGGYYDRTLASLKGQVISCGVALSQQMVKKVPRDLHDEPLDHMITGHGVWDRHDRHKD